MEVALSPLPETNMILCSSSKERKGTLPNSSSLLLMTGVAKFLTSQIAYCLSDIMKPQVKIFSESPSHVNFC